MLVKLKKMLVNLSYDDNLFAKMLAYALFMAKYDEAEQLKYWVIENFWHTHQKEIRDVLGNCV